MRRPNAEASTAAIGAVFSVEGSATRGIGAEVVVIADALVRTTDEARDIGDEAREMDTEALDAVGEVTAIEGAAIETGAEASRIGSTVAGIGAAAAGSIAKASTARWTGRSPPRGRERNSTGDRRKEWGNEHPAAGDARFPRGKRAEWERFVSGTPVLRLTNSTGREPISRSRAPRASRAHVQRSRFSTNF